MLRVVVYEIALSHPSLSSSPLSHLLFRLMQKLQQISYLLQKQGDRQDISNMAMMISKFFCNEEFSYISDYSTNKERLKRALIEVAQ